MDQSFRLRKALGGRPQALPQGVLRWLFYLLFVATASGVVKDVLTLLSSTKQIAMNGQTYRADSTKEKNGFQDLLQSLDQVSQTIAAQTTAAQSRNASQEEELSSEDLKALLLTGNDPLGNSMQNITATLYHGEIQTCFGCETPLGLPALRAGDRPEIWRCTECSAIFLTGNTYERLSSIQNAERAFREVTVPVDKLPTQCPKNLEELIIKIAGASYVGAERRASPRYRISLPAIGMPLDDNYQSDSRGVHLTLRDISSEGLSFFSDKELACPFVLVDMTSAGFLGAQVVLEVRRCRSLGLMYEIAGTFV